MSNATFLVGQLQFFFKETDFIHTLWHSAAIVNVPEDMTDVLEIGRLWERFTAALNSSNCLFLNFLYFCDIES